MAARTYSSIREALACGILEEPADCGDTSSDTISQGSSRSTARRSTICSRSSSTTTAGSAHLSRSFTAAGSARRRPSYQPDRRSSSLHSNSFGSTNGEAEGHPQNSIIAVRQICLSSSPPPATEVDLAEMTPADLDELRKDDPFAYFSIPEVHRRTYRFEAGLPSDDILRHVLGADHYSVDDGNEEGDAGGAAGGGAQARSRSRLAASMPAGLLADADIAHAEFEAERRNGHPASIVDRKRRLSCEAHPSLVCEGMALGGGEWGGEEWGEEDDEAGDEAEERLLRLMMREAGMDHLAEEG